MTGSLGPAIAVAAVVVLIAGRLAWPDDPAAPSVPPGTPVVTAQPADLLYRPTSRWVAVARTDAGRPIRLAEPIAPRPAAVVAADEDRVLGGLGLAPRLTRRGPASEACNCHGWIFAEGRYWVHMAEVQMILADNGYQPVTAPRPGDLAVYREAGGGIAHTAIVRRVGGHVIVEGKWTWMGVFEHAVEDSPFGTDVVYYRTARPGHRLAGLDRLPGPNGEPVPPGSPGGPARARGPYPNR